MTELELELRALADELAVPPTPDIAPAVMRRIRRRHATRRALLAIAAAAAALGIAFAVPPARSALLRFFHLEGVTVERVDTLPPGPARALGRSLGTSMPLPAAEARLGFRFALPRGARPTHARVIGVLGTVLLETRGRPLLLSEFRGRVFDLMKKVAGPATLVEPVTVDGAPAIWVEGATHFLYLGRGGGIADLPVAIHGNVLLWQHDGLTLRLQGRVTKDEALQVAASVR
jgi:hypothetical protein